MPGPRVILTDFGLAKSTTTGSRYTRSGEALGTPAYMSPEQARGELAGLTPASDTWALGCVLYELLAGRPAFDADTTAGIIGQILTSRPAPLVGVPPDAVRIVHACLQQQPQGRFADAALARDDLARVAVGERSQAPRPGGRRTWASLAAAGVAATVIVLALLQPWSVPAPTNPPAAESHADAVAEEKAERGWRQRSTDPLGGAQLLAQAIAAVPDRAEWRIRHGLLLWAGGDAAAAREVWTGIVEPQEAARRAHLYLGLEALFRRERGQLQTGEARPHLEAAIVAAGDAGRLANGAIAFIDRSYDVARRALQDVPGWEAALLRGAVESGAAENLDLALTELTAAIDNGFALAWAFDARGFTHDRLRHVEAALRDYERALELDPENVGTYYNRGTSLARDHRYAEAHADFDLVIDRLARFVRDGSAPHLLAESYSQRGYCLVRMGDDAGARADFDRALILDPDLTDALNNRASWHLKHRDAEAAFTDLERSLRVDPNQWAARLLRGNVHLRRRDLELALADYDAAARLVPREPTVYVNRAIVRHMRGDVEGAEADFALALDLAPDEWPARPKIAQNLAQVRAELAARGG